MAGLASQPNVIVVMCDQMRWDAAGFAGSPTVRTPNLDRLAAGRRLLRERLLRLSRVLAGPGEPG